MSIHSSDNEMLERHLRIVEAERMENLKASADLILKFSEYCAAKGVMLSESNFDYNPRIGLVAKYPNIFSRLVPDIQKDKDGLYSFKDLKRRFHSVNFNPGYLSGEMFMVMAHPHFRRGFHEVNNYTPHFVDVFWGFESDEVESYVAIDENRVRINLDSSFYVESDTWFGAPFKKDVSSIKNGIVKLRPPLDLGEPVTSFLFANAYCLDIKWSEREGIKSFQAMEFKTTACILEVDGVTTYPVRYLHAQYDLKTNSLFHFDGAIQYLREREYFERRDSDLNHNDKTKDHVKAEYRKLFKLNGCIDTDVFVDMASHFYTGNPLIHEYFSGKYPDGIIYQIDRVRAKRNSAGDT